MLEWIKYFFSFLLHFDLVMVVLGILMLKLPGFSTASPEQAIGYIAFGAIIRILRIIFKRRNRQE